MLIKKRIKRKQNIFKLCSDSYKVGTELEKIDLIVTESKKKSFKDILQNTQEVSTSKMLDFTVIFFPGIFSCVIFQK